MDYARHTSATKRSANPYVDNYTGFTWNNIHSSRFNCFIENTGHLSFEPAPSFSNNFTSPTFQNRSYYTGMQSQTKKIQLHLVFYKLTLSDLNEALEWLDRTVVSDLFLDYEPYWKYSCKLASIGTMEKYVDGAALVQGVKKDLYIGRVEVSFETVYQPEALSIYSVYGAHHPNEGSEGSGSGEGYQSMDDICLSDFFDASIPANELIHSELIDSEHKQWSIILKNPSPRPTYFKVNCYDITSYFQLDYLLVPIGQIPVDVDQHPITISQATLSFDPGHVLHLHYNSEDGNLLTANQSIESLQGFETHNVCNFAQSLANILIPGANNGCPGEVQLILYGSDDWSVEYNIYNNII